MMQDFWTTAMGNNIIPAQEWLMQGSVVDQHKDTLKHRLEGLCDNTETGEEKFADHEMVYSLKHGEHGMRIHVRQALDHPHNPWHIRYLGDDMNKVDNIIVRSCLESAVSNNILDYLRHMGFRLDYEYVAKGTMYRRGKMRITISSIFKMQNPGDTVNIDQVTMSHLVELSVMAAKTEQVEQDMKSFAEQLKPLVTLEKVDHRQL